MKQSASHHTFSRWPCRCSGNEELKKKYGLKVVGPRADEGRIPAIDVALSEGDTWDFGQLHLEGTPPQPPPVSVLCAHAHAACMQVYIHTRLLGCNPAGSEKVVDGA